MTVLRFVSKGAAAIPVGRLAAIVLWVVLACVLGNPGLGI